MKANTLITYYRLKPLNVIILSGLILRLLATIFSRGYGWHDDQFLIIEIAQSWVDGIDYYSWLPSADGTNMPEGFSFFYVGLHYLLFSLFEFIGIYDPQSKMLIIRFIHAIWSLLIIYYGYMITLRLSNIENAKLVGWILSLFWIFPMISVRNLVEYVCIPLVLYGLYLILSANKGSRKSIWIWAGIIFGIAFNIRFQTGLLLGSFGLVILFQKKWKEAVFLAIGGIISIVLIQGVIDYFVWGKPFVQVVEYVNYNLHNAALYVVSPWYTYLFFIAGILIPPVSLFLIAGTFKKWRSLLIIFLPILIFIAFHSYYPNKQERFVVTILPLLIIIGIIGWQSIKEQYIKSDLGRRIVRGSWIFFWVINFILLIPITVMYSKQARVESMIYLSKYDNINNFIIEDVNQRVLGFPPQFYLKGWYKYQTLMKNDDFNEFKEANSNRPASEQPGFILFYQPDNIELRAERMMEIYPNLEFETVIEPGFMDHILYRLNPINSNQNIYIYRNKAVIPKEIQ